MTPAEVASLLERNQVEILAKLGATWLPKGIYTFIVEEAVSGLIRGIRAGDVQPDSGEAIFLVSLPDREWAELEHPGASIRSWTKKAGALRKALSARKPLPWSIPVTGEGAGQSATEYVIEGGIYRSTDGKVGRPRKDTPGDGLGAETGVWLRILHDGKPVDFEAGDTTAARNPLKASLASRREKLRLLRGALVGFEDALVNLHRAGEHSAADGVVESLHSSNLSGLAKRLQRSVAERLGRIPRALLIAIITALLAGGTAVAVYLWVKHMTGRLHRDPQRQGQAVTGKPAGLPLIDSRAIDHPRFSGRLDIYSKDNREARLIFTPANVVRLANDSNLEWRWWIKEGTSILSTGVTGTPELAHTFMRPYDAASCDVDIDLVEYYEGQHAPVGQTRGGLLTEVDPTTAQPVGSPAPEVVVTTDTEIGPVHRVLTGWQVGGRGGTVALTDIVIGVSPHGVCRTAQPPPAGTQPTIVLFSCPASPGSCIVGVAARAIVTLGCRVELEFGDGQIAADAPPVQVDDEWSAYLEPRFMRMFAVAHVYPTKSTPTVSAWTVRGGERRLLVRQRVTVP